MLQYINRPRQTGAEGLPQHPLSSLTFYAILDCFLVRCTALSTVLQSFEYRKVVSSREGVVYNENKAA